MEEMEAITLLLTLLFSLQRHPPREAEIRGVFFAPLFLCVLLGMAAAWGTATALSKADLFHHFENPLLVFLAFSIIYAVIFSIFLVPA
ncbi:DUF1656 domain-containing protein [Synechococcus sp. BSF8S]|nr:DUF1656 domain-containing protein [Synechococcus sp. BSF8S]MBC1264548.1 DUF1656 domain-containing protein [Synechococcus sp. BSA11S]